MEGCAEDCPIGGEGCDCTGGGGCDVGLVCLSNTCVNAGPNATDLGNGDDDGDDDEAEDSESSGDGSTTGSTDGESSEGEDDVSTDSSGGGPKLDTLQEEGADDGPCAETGCKKVDMLFALDGSASMIEEINALKAGAAFLGIVEALESLNCGDIDYRIGVTGDNDNGWITPPGWSDLNPWFDSLDYGAGDIATHFLGAANAVAASGGASVGCEHVLTSAVNLLSSDSSGFLRDDALLVLVLLTDVDDYGWYDQLGGAPEPFCEGFGCATAPQPVATLQDTLVALKDGDQAGVATIVIAGDPNANGGVNFCGQPQSCATAFHAERLYEFAEIQTGANGYAHNLCAGAATVPTAVEAALSEDIDLACQSFEPVG
ncbi:hypothetical protein PPSIR1_20594 [Plesiocystis pacifica SIR-1]|uniref:VWFA domain-containing protein n=2 Tax=Plesiocystis pacifica TaxID=191768 RepID=A6G295_9BACT|nr:hypothetical protein PPSIR1_20594 [Plesiocystis pacifica SIR-1]